MLYFQEKYQDLPGFCGELDGFDIFFSSAIFSQELKLKTILKRPNARR